MGVAADFNELLSHQAGNRVFTCHKIKRTCAGWMCEDV